MKTLFSTMLVMTHTTTGTPPTTMATGMLRNGLHCGHQGQVEQQQRENSANPKIDSN